MLYITNTICPEMMSSDGKFNIREISLSEARNLVASNKCKTTIKTIPLGQKTANILDTPLEPSKEFIILKEEDAIVLVRFHTAKRLVDKMCIPDNQTGYRIYYVTVKYD